MKRQSKHSRIAALTAASVLTFALAFPASAQDAAPEAPDAELQRSDGEIIVTAQKRSGELQRIPAAITALGSEALEERGITDFLSLSTQVPSVNFSELTGSTFVTIRGVGVSVDSGIGEPSVASYIDGVYLPRATMARLQMVDLERVEVLRGPQGTLYGRNSTGGAVNFVAAAPTADFHAGANLTVGNYDQREFGGFVSGPLSEGVQIRLSASRDVRDGLVRNIFNNERYTNKNGFSVRGAVRFLPTPDLTIDISALYQENHNKDSVLQALRFTSPFPPGTVMTTEPRRVASDYSTVGYNDLLVLAGTINWDLGNNFSIRSVSGYVDHHSLVSFDGDATSQPKIVLEGFVRPSSSFSQEVDFLGEVGPVKFLIGAYYFDEHYTATIPVTVIPGAGASIPPGATIFRTLDQNIRSFALFTDGTISLTDRLRVNFGLRFNDERSKVLQTSGIVSAAGVFAGVRDRPEQTKSSDLLPKIGLEFDVTDRILAYGQFQKGIKSGGPNIGVFNGPFRPEQIKSYEVGLKSRLFDNAVTLNLSAFHYDYTDLQVTNIPAGSPTAVIVNAQAKVNGLEAELNARASEYLEFDLAGTLTEAEYTEFSGIDAANAAAGVQNLRGNKLTRTPPYTLRAGTNVTVPIGSGFFDRIVLRGEVFASGRYYLRPFNTVDEEQKAYTLLNASVSLVSADDRYRLRAFMNNIGKTDVLQAVQFSSLSGGYSGAYGPPRTYGIALSARF